MSTYEIIGLILIGIAILALISIVVFLGLWTYRDAKEKGLNAVLWTLVVVLGSQNLIGLLLYILIGRKNAKIICPECSAQTSAKAKYCEQCGKSIEKVKLPASHSAKKWLIAMLVAFLLFVVVMGSGIAVMVINDAVPALGENISIGKIETYYGGGYGGSGGWKTSYASSTETLTKTIKIDENGPKVLYFKGYCAEGTMLLVVKTDNEITTYRVTSWEADVPIDVTKTGSVTLELINSKVKHGEFEARWE